MLVSYNWLKSYFDEKLPEPEKLVDVLSLHAFEIEGLEKVGDDWVIDVDVLPNRAHDCLSHIGIARELSVILSKPLKAKVGTVPTLPQSGEVEPLQIENGPASLQVEILNKEKCRRYIGLEVNNIKVGLSPEWLKERLEAIGQRSINNIVDATNYVMLSMGQPLHAFDADKLASKKIIVRDAKEGEKITLLTGEEIELSESNLVIADGSTGSPQVNEVLAIAGVKGGTKAEVDESTKNIILESANFDPVSIRKTARSLNIQTDSSKRFENEITPEMAELGMSEVIKLLLEIAKTPETEVMKSVDVYPNPIKPWNVSVSAEEVNKVLGTKLKAKEITDIFDRFGFKTQMNADNVVFEVQIPPERLDLKIKEDLIEEIGRIYGYANIESVLPEPAQSEINKEFYYLTKIRNILVKEGFSEVYTYSFVDEGEVELQNPLASDKKFLRSNLDELSESLNFNSRNEDLLGLECTKIFEIGTVFNKEGEHIALGFSTNGGEKRRKEIVNLLSKELGQDIKPEIHADVFEVNLSELIGELDDPKSYDDLDMKISDLKIQYKPFSLYPVVLRDIAVWIPDKVSPEELIALIKENAGPLLITEPRLFDTFSKEGKTSYAYRLVFQSHEKTLSDEEVNSIMDRIYKEIEKKEGWEGR